VKKLLPILVLILIGCSEPEPIDIDKLNYRGEIYYKVNSSEPYSGDVFSVYPNGQYQRYGNLKNGKFVGSVKYFHVNGQLESEEMYENGKLKRVSKFFLENGQLESEEMYENGKLNGVSKFFLENGQLVEEGNYINDLKDGTYMLYHENGQISQEIVYSYGKRNGKINQFEQDGKLSLEGMYTDDKKSGTWKWYENGELLKQEVFKTEDDLRIKKSELNNSYIFNSKEFIPLEGLITNPVTIRFQSYRENYININDGGSDKEFFIFYESIKNNSNTFTEIWNSKEKYFFFSNTTSLEFILFSESSFLDISTDIINDSPVELFFSKEPFGITIKKYVSKN